LEPPVHHKEVARFLKEATSGDAKVTVFRDNNNASPIPVGAFGSGKKRLYSTIGAFDMHLDLPPGDFEFAACGDLGWLPSALASSIYWLKTRACGEWPLICEDAVKHNAKSTYRHMAYAPSSFSLEISAGKNIQWLLGVPIRDNEIGLSSRDVMERAQEIYPEWLFCTSRKLSE
jgi:hypothetical protein